MPLQATMAATLVDEWIRNGVTDAVVCPGNRSTLLSTRLVEDGRMRVHVFVDERSAAFFALGLGLAGGRTALLWCTSGTAAAEFHAAVIEADQARVPLLICTADRPPELHHSRDWQSTDQTHLYGRATRWFFDLGVASEAMMASWRSIASRAVIETSHNALGPGPVHVNIPIREPIVFAPGPVPMGRSHGSAWHTVSGLGAASGIAQRFTRSACRGVIVAGRGAPRADLIHACAQALGWPVIADLRSGCRVPSPTTIGAADALVRVEAFASAHLPEVVLRFGEPVISKPVADWLRAARSEEWLVDPYGTWTGPAADAQYLVRADPESFCEQLLATDPESADPQWLKTWIAAEEVAQSTIDSILLQQGSITEPAVARSLVAGLADDAALFAATSMPVRDVECYGAPRSGLHVFANRGASGLDGLASTAAGVAVGRGGKPACLLVGDLGFLYDLNALWTTGGIDGDLQLAIVVVDNGGGGIFSFVPQLTSMAPHIYERIVGTPQRVDIASVAEALGVPCKRVTELSELLPAVADAIHAGGIRLIYVRTDREMNASLYDAVNAAIRNRLL